MAIASRLAKRSSGAESAIAASSGSSISQPRLISGDNRAPTTTTQVSSASDNSEMSWASTRLPVRARWTTAASGNSSQARALIRHSGSAPTAAR